ncbi:AraC family transcriptional regulator [Vibrio celticus]|uniref:HTH-type transcriptional activator RhaS n=1 Tax=Vibrio celticus TaxID=446372 RepID=A0A1C3JIR0_9VIBR|nr:AraC family transcriptional regulator [Vibrio celticus]SBT15007.1 HTH-type transcriptional activator RhaS [Vibrio celticus]
MSASSLFSNISGIHSKQPFFVLSSEQFLTHLAPDIPEVSHFYSFKAGRSQESTIAIPDGCIDIVFDCNSASPVGQVCGTRLEAGAVSFDPGHQYFGVRFVPGVFPDFLAISAKELIEHELDLHDVIAGSDRLLEQVIYSENFSQKVDVVSQFLKKKQRRKTSELTNQVIAKIRQHKGNIQIQDLERFSGYTSRTLQRTFKNDIGLTPKGFSRAIRCQSAVYDINHREDLTFSDLAIDLGFSDQSHFLREFKKLVNFTPQEYHNKVKEKTYRERIHCY